MKVFVFSVSTLKHTKISCLRNVKKQKRDQKPHAESFNNLHYNMLKSKITEKMLFSPT